MKIGRWTVAGTLVIIGLSLIVGLLTKMNLVGFLLPWWPVIIISLGFEILFSHKRNDIKRKYDIAGFVIVGILIVVGLGQSFTLGGVFDHVSSEGAGPIHELEPIVIPAEDRNVLDLKNSNGTISVQSYDGNEISIDPAIGGRVDNPDRLRKKFDFEVDQNGSQVTVNVRGPHHRVWFFNRANFYTVHLDVKIPDSLDLDLHTNNGKISVHDLSADVTADSSNGKIELTKVDGNVDLKTSNGIINVTGVQGDVKAETNNGKVNINNVGGDLRVKSDNGAIVIHSAQLSGDWQAETNLGAIEVTLPERADAFVEANTEVGAVSVASDARLSNSQNHRDMVSQNFTGTIGSGTHQVRLKTDVGSINIK